MKLRQKLRTYEFESQKQKNGYEEQINGNEKTFQGQIDAYKEINDDLEKQLDSQELKLRQEKEDEQGFFLDELEDLKVS